MSSFYESVKEQAIAVYETVVEGTEGLKNFILEAWPVLLFLSALLFVSLWVSDPIPPRKVVMAVGAKTGSDYLLAQKYQEYFKDKGVDLEIVNTNGSMDSLKLLKDKDSPVNAAFVMSGSAEPKDKDILTLGAVDYEPLWCFYKADTDYVAQNHTAIKSLLTKQINIGAEGTGTFNEISKILRLIKIDPTTPYFHKYPTVEAIEKMKNGEIDITCVADTEDSPNVQTLINLPDVYLISMEKAEAFARKIPSIEVVTVPDGSLNLAEGLPKQEVKMLSSTREILVDKDLHPALQTLFLMAARKINGGESFFAKEGEFPSFKDNTLKRSEEAEVYYSKGEPYMVSWLPFWASEFLRRLFLTLLPLAAIAYPVIKSTPNYYKNRVRGRINKLYGAVKFFEQELVNNYEKDKKDEYLRKLLEIEDTAIKMKVPKSISQDYFTMRSTIEFIANRLLNNIYEKESEALEGQELQKGKLDSIEAPNDTQ